MYFRASPFREKLALLKDMASEYSQIVLLGFTENMHSHRYIHMQWHAFFKSTGIKCVWLENPDGFLPKFTKNSLIVIPDLYLKTYGPINVELDPDCTYVFHRGDNYDHAARDAVRHINVFEHRQSFVRNFDKLGKRTDIDIFICTYPELKIIVQPWGCPLLEAQFHRPCSFRTTRKIYFIGNKWGNKEGEATGNFQKLERIEKELEEIGFQFVVKNRISTADEIALMRSSFCAISPGAERQSENGYLTCKVFKNIGYGRLAFTDILPFKDILGDVFMPMGKISDAILLTSAISEDKEKELCHRQQEAIKKYTYLDMWLNMFQFIKMVN